MKVILGWLTCKPGTREEFLTAMEPHVEATIREPGCQFFEYHRHKDAADVVVLIEGFRDVQAHEFHRRTAHMAAMQAEVRRLLTRVKLVNIVSDELTRDDLDFVSNPLGPYRP